MRFPLNVHQRLRRSVLSCLLWEKTFYEDGQDITERIYNSALKSEPQFVADLAIEARQEMNLRHVPLVLISALARTASGTSLVSETIHRVVSRADELAEFLAIHAVLNGRELNDIKPVMSAQIKKGLASAFHKFDEYQLAKYDRANDIRLRDVLFLSHAKPETTEQAEMWQRLIDGKLQTPDTWEVGLSSGGDKMEVFTRLLQEKRLGYMALLRNLRNMIEADVDRELIESAILERRGARRVLPFRFISAARAVPQLEQVLDEALLASIEDMPQWDGLTYVLVDVSGSMSWSNISGGSQLTYMDAAATLASIIPSRVRLFTFSNRVVEVPPRRGMAGVDAIISSQNPGGTYLGASVKNLNGLMGPEDRFIVITDEQSHDPVGDPVSSRAYMINVAPYERGVVHDGAWTTINGFSESILRYISEIESH